MIEDLAISIIKKGSNNIRIKTNPATMGGLAGWLGQHQHLSFRSSPATSTGLIPASGYLPVATSFFRSAIAVARSA